MSVGAEMWRRTEWDYKPMADRHAALWRFMPKWIRAFGIRSLLEVGGADGRLTEYVDRHTIVDVAPRLWPGRILRYDERRQHVREDWLGTMIQPFIGRYDAFVSLAVVEHCDGFERFLDRALACEPKYVCISFFNGLTKGSEQRHIVKSRSGHLYHHNHYSLKSVKDFLVERELTGRAALVNLPAQKNPDWLLLLDVGDAPDAAFAARCEALALESGE